MRDYIQYLQDVLGLQKILLPIDEARTSDTSLPQFYCQNGIFNPQQVAHYELIFLNILTQSKESLFLPEVQELFGKMKAAMKLRNLQVLELDCTVDDRSLLPSRLAQVCEAQVVVVFSSFPRNLGEFVFKGPGQWLETYSPSYLLEDSGAKKVVWNDLQKVMKELGL